MGSDDCSRGPSRRDIHRGAIGLAGVAAFCGKGLLSGVYAQAVEPKRGGRLRVAGHSQSATDTLDPARFVVSTDYARGHMFYNGLTRLDGNINPGPELAESWEPNANGTQWVFKLRQGVTFHDGAPLTAEDVVFSILRHKDEKVASAAKPLAQQIEDVKADGQNVVIRLKAPNADLPILLGTFHFMVLKQGTTDFTTAIGTGPFKCKEFRPGVRSVAVRNENYFKDGKPYLDEIELFGIVDPVARMNALISGDVEMISDLRPAAVAEIEKDPRLQVLSTASPRFMELAMMVDRAPTNNLDLRLAIKHLMDRERVVNLVLHGHGLVANDHPVMPASDLYNKALPQRNLDYDKAKFYLRKAGFENGRIDMHVSEASTNSPEMGLLLQRDAARVGLTIDLKREPAEGYWTNIWMKRAFHAVMWNPRPTYDMQLMITWRSNAPWNSTHFSSDRLDKLIDEGRATLGIDKRREIYGEIQQIVYEQGGSLIPCFLNFLDAHSRKVKGLIPIPVGNLGGFAFADTVWLDV